MKGIINGKVILENRIVENKVLLFDEKILDIVDICEASNYKNLQLIDADGKYVSPGFIDLHVHGYGGYDTMDGSLESIEMISNLILKNGITGFLPTTMTMDMKSIHSALDSVRDFLKKDLNGAQVLGAHLEGPFINPKYKGAQNEMYIIKPNYNLIKDYLDVIKIITLAPEIDGSSSFIKEVKKHSGVTLSIGHSSATYEDALEAFKEGSITYATHLFNAMTPLHHRSPGVVGAVFNCDKVTCELIADKIHVHPGIFKILVNIKGSNKIVLVTDCTRAGGLEDGLYNLGGQEIQVESGACKLEDGTLAGSILNLNEGLKNFIENTDIDILDAVKMVSLNPARVLGLESVKGSIEKGKDADITIFDSNFKVDLTIVKGKVLFNDIQEA